jgi:hypothetical protein
VPSLGSGAGPGGNFIKSRLINPPAQVNQVMINSLIILGFAVTDNQKRSTI